MDILIADEHVLARHGLSVLLKDFWPSANINSVDNAIDTVRFLYRDDKLDVIIIDLSMLDSQGFDVVSSTLREHPDCYLVLLLLSASPELLSRAYDLGVHAAIRKCSDNTKFKRLFRAIENSERYFPDLNTGMGAGIRNSCLTNRQQDVLQLLLKGLSNKEIARQLSISHETVKVHVSAIMRFFNASNRTEVSFSAQQLAMDPQATN